MVCGGSKARKTIGHRWIDDALRQDNFKSRLGRVAWCWWWWGGEGEVRKIGTTDHHLCLFLSPCKGTIASWPPAHILENILIAPLLNWRRRRNWEEWWFSPHIADLQSARSRLIWELCTRFTTEIAAFMAAALIPEMAAALPEIANFTMIRCRQHQHSLKSNG